jgi:hypothetical protein
MQPHSVESRIVGSAGFDTPPLTRDLASLAALSGAGQSWTRFRYIAKSDGPWELLRVRLPWCFPLEAEAPLPTGVLAHELVELHLAKRDRVVEALKLSFQIEPLAVALLVDGGYLLRQTDHVALLRWLSSVLPGELTISDDELAAFAAGSEKVDRLTDWLAAATEDPASGRFYGLVGTALALLTCAVRNRLPVMEAFDMGGVSQQVLCGEIESEQWLNTGLVEAPPERFPATPLTTGHEWMMQGKELLEEGRIDEAGAMLRKAIAVDPFGGLEAQLLGSVLSAQGRHAEAAAEFFHAARQTVLGGRLERARAMENVAVSWHLAGERERARPAYDAAILWAGQSGEEPRALAKYLANRAELLLELGELEPAVTDIRAALELSPDEENALTQKARAIEGGASF